MEQLKQYDDFLVLPELKELIRPLSIKEHQTLEESILKDGILDSLKLGTIPITYCKYCAEDHDQWNILEPGAGGFLMTCEKCDHSSVQDYYLIDGHNRLAIAEKHGIPYGTDCMEFESMGHIKLWITSNQLGRRNLTETEVKYYRGKEHDFKMVADKFKGNQYTKLVTDKLSVSTTSEQLAEKHGVTARTIERDVQMSRGIDHLSDDLKQKVLSEEVKPRKQDLEIIAKAEPEFVAHTEQEILDKAKEIRQKKSEAKIAARKEYIKEQVKQIELGELPELNGKFNVISIDPPWPYGREYDPESSRVANPYPEMSIQQIKAIELPDMDDSILWLWTTHKFLPDAFDIMKHWEYEYKATMVWDKEKIGMGAWLRMQCEFCLLGIKGKPVWDNTTERDIIREARREHSRKPDSFFDIVDKICVGRKLEYFSREARPGWEVFGNETNKF